MCYKHTSCQVALLVKRTEFEKYISETLENLGLWGTGIHEDNALGAESRIAFVFLLFLFGNIKSSRTFGIILLSE